jgi:hypothetical protein
MIIFGKGHLSRLTLQFKQISFDLFIEVSFDTVARRGFIQLGVELIFFFVDYLTKLMYLWSRKPLRANHFEKHY